MLIDIIRSVRPSSQSRFVQNFSKLSKFLAAPSLRLVNTSRYFASVDQQVKDPSVLKSKFNERLHVERAKSLLGGGQDRIDRQHAKGSLTARERLDLLFDENTFRELDIFKAHRCTEFNMEKTQHPGDGVITGVRNHVIAKFVINCIIAASY